MKKLFLAAAMAVMSLLFVGCSKEHGSDGSLLLMRWVDNGVEYREWWEIIALDNFNMVWGATRLDENGQRYPATVTLERIDLT